MVVTASETKENLELWLDSQKEVVMRVRLYTYKCFGRYRWRLSLDGLIVEAFIDVYTGKRHVPEDKDRVACMCKIVRSKFNNWREKGKPIQESLEDNFEQHYSEDPTDLLLVRCYMRELAKGDPILEEIVELWSQDWKLKPSDLAEIINISVEEVYNALKRLRRRIEKERNH